MCESTDERILKHRPLVYIEASKYRGLLEFEDACSYGMIGLVQAARVWKPESGFAFASVAKRSIKARIVDGVRDEHGRSGKKLEFRRSQTSLDGAVAEYVSSAEDTAGVAFAGISTARVAEAVKLLDPRAAAIIDLRFGAGWSLRDIAMLYGLNENKVGQIIRQSLECIRAWLAGKGITTFSEASS